LTRLEGLEFDYHVTDARIERDPDGTFSLVGLDAYDMEPVKFKARGSQEGSNKRFYTVWTDLGTVGVFGPFPPLKGV
jgi:hypothetical protein